MAPDPLRKSSRFDWRVCGQRILDASCTLRNAHVDDQCPALLTNLTAPGVSVDVAKAACLAPLRVAGPEPEPHCEFSTVCDVHISQDACADARIGQAHVCTYHRAPSSEGGDFCNATDGGMSAERMDSRCLPPAICRFQSLLLGLCVTYSVLGFAALVAAVRVVVDARSPHECAAPRPRRRRSQVLNENPSAHTRPAGCNLQPSRRAPGRVRSRCRWTRGSRTSRPGASSLSSTTPRGSPSTRRRRRSKSLARNLASFQTIQNCCGVVLSFSYWEPRRGGEDGE